MKTQISWTRGIWLAAGVVAVVALLLHVHASPVPAAKRGTVVIELFTSEGCSSCPPADALLSGLEHTSSANGAEIIALGFHVDYWNDQGWQDRFSSHDYTLRQEKYAGKFREEPYTPQLVIDGESQLVGSDSRAVEQAITQAAAQQQQADVKLSWQAPDKLLVAATSAESAPPAQVILAITEDDLATNVAGGENGGHVLHHSAVVRKLQVLGELKQGRFEMQIPVKPDHDWKLKDLRLVAFVQPAPLGPIKGAAAIALPSASPAASAQ